MLQWLFSKLPALSHVSVLFPQGEFPEVTGEKAMDILLAHDKYCQIAFQKSIVQMMLEHSDIHKEKKQTLL